VVISEVYGGGGNTGAVYTHDFIELYNPTSLPIVLTGWSVQYASATGTGAWQKTDLTGTIPAKGFFLVQEAAGTGGSTALPTPDVTGTLALSGTTGKVALVSNSTALSGQCPTAVIDLVGWGTANCNEGASNAPATSNTTSIERKASSTSTAASLSAGGAEVLAGNGYDTDVNGSDFVVKPLADINPQNSSVIEGVVGNTVSVAVGTVPAEPATNGTFIVTLSSAAPTGGVTVTYTIGGTATAGTDYTALSGTVTIPELATTSTININVIDDALAEGNETITIALQTATAGYTPVTTTVSTAITDNEVTVTPIHTIQGTGTTATAGTFTSEAIVTGVYPNLSPAGFYMQEEDADADTYPLTSEGIFVVTTDVVSVGDRVRVTGTVLESTATPSFGQAVFNSATVTIINNSIALPAAVNVTLPVTAINDFERYEGMLVQFPATLTVTNNYTLGRFGEVGLSANGAVYQPSQVIDVNDATPSGTTSTGTSNLAAINALATSNALRTILLDDGTNNTVTLPYADPVDHTLRIGSTVSNLKGIMGYAFSVYRIQPIPTATPVFTYAPRPTLPAVGASNVKVACFNVLNYFNGNGQGGGFPTERGANSAAEFTRQRNKIINAIAQINADLVGLMEIENDGTGTNSAIQDLVNGLNAVLGANTYSFINDGASSQTFGTDAIRCGMLYKSANLTPVGVPMLSASDTFNRPPFAQKFTSNTSGLPFVFVVNHYKSKGCTGATGADLDQLDGQAC
ncbi:MAG: ExeM/NucH family extracellular endonuclease, partial [Sphingobacteriales bacterium]